MADVLFIGPIAETGGPAIKNRILVEHLRATASLRICNTYDRSVRARLGAVCRLLFAREDYIIVAVSRKGRALLYPLLSLKKRLSGCRYVCVFIGGQMDATFRRKSALRAAHRADLVTVETETLKRKTATTFRLRNLFYMPNYKEMEQVLHGPKDEDFAHDPLRMIFLSRVCDEKGVQTLLRSFCICKKQGVPVELDFYGPLDNKLDPSFLTALEGTDGARYCGTVPNDQVLDVMRGYQLFIFPTEAIGEGFPAVLVEAQAAGLPVVASDICGNDDLIQDGVNGFVFPHGDVSALAEVIARCCGDREALRRISRENLVHARQYDAARVIDGFAAALRDLGWPVSIG